MTSEEFSIQLDRVYPKIFIMVRNFYQDDEDQKDLVQETLAKAWKSKKSFKTGTNFHSWIFVIMKNTYINHYQKRKRIAQKSLEIKSDFTYNHALTDLEYQDLSELINKIPEKFRIPFLMYFKGYKYYEISERLNLPIGTVKNHIHLARKKLKQQISKHREFSKLIL